MKKQKKKSKPRKKRSILDLAISDRGHDTRPAARKLLRSIKAALPELRELLDLAMHRGVYEDGIYRLYHHSFKVYSLQAITTKIVRALYALSPNKRFSTDFQNIVKEGIGKTWEPAHNRRWWRETRPIVEAFLHAKYFLEMVVKFGGELDKPPQVLPFGWAAVLYLYSLR